MPRNPLPKPPKDDDDSWGKLASDLLGIDFDVEDDFDFPEADIALPAVPPEPVSAVAAETVDSVTVAADQVQNTVETSPGKISSDDEFWQILEEWDWDEAGTRPKASSRPARDVKKAEEVQATERPTSGSQRERRPRRSQAERGPREEREHTELNRSEEKTVPQSEETFADSARQPRSREAERRDIAPAHQMEPGRPRDERRPTRASRSEPDQNRDTPPSREGRKERPNRSEGRVAPRRQPERGQPERAFGDEFGEGLESKSYLDDPWSEIEPARPSPESGADAKIYDDGFEDECSSLIESGEIPAETDEDSEDRPRRRRRRRRRGKRMDEGENRLASNELPEDQGISDDEFEESRAASSDPVEVVGDEIEAEVEPRRRPRRQRRRPDDGGTQESAPQRPARAARPRPVERHEPAERHDEEEFSEERPRKVIRSNYDDIPTWEEAISYMLPDRSNSGDQRHSGGRRPDRRPPRGQQRADW